MAKLKTVYVCSKCNYQSPRWTGQCYECKAWNSLVEDVIDENEAPKSELVKTDTIETFSL